MKELFTQDNLKQFEKWFLVDYRGYKDPRHLETYRVAELNLFYGYEFEMQKGVIEKYYQYEHDIDVRVTVDDARKEFKELNEIVNKNA